jgi:arsenate reductase
MVIQKSKVKVLFLCTGNSCRSQMAEGLANRLKSDVVTAYSAGISPAGIHPLTVRVMEEVGVDISGQRSKSVTELGDILFDYVVTLCGSAAEHCPRFPGKSRVIHVGFDDPASAEGTEEERLEAFRRVRGAILEFVENLPWELEHHEENE